MSVISISSFLKSVLLVDAVATTATGLLLVTASAFLSPILGLPSNFLTAAGLPLLPFAAYVGWLSVRPTAPATAVRLIIWINALWVAGSVGLIFARVFEPTTLGVAFVLAQAAAVGAFAAFQLAALRRIYA
jgi:hypothetical protein